MLAGKLIIHIWGFKITVKSSIKFTFIEDLLFKFHILYICLNYIMFEVNFEHKQYMIAYLSVIDL